MVFMFTHTHTRRGRETEAFINFHYCLKLRSREKLSKRAEKSNVTF